MLNIRELARLAGVSHGAVSLALRGRPGVSAETRARVVKLAAQFGYRPNPMVAALMTQVGTRQRRSVKSIIGLLSTMDMDHYPVHSTPHLYHEGIKRAAHLAGYVVESFTFERFDAGVPLARMLDSRRVQGLILYQMRDDFERLAIEKHRFAFVAAGVSMKERQVDFVCNDHGHTVQLAIDNLWRLGYRRLGLALDGGRREHEESAMLGAMLEWQFRTKVCDRIPPLIMPKWTPAALLSWFRSKRPDAIICSDHLAIDWLKKDGVRVPQDVAFAHLDLDPRWKGMAGINQCNEEVGAATMDLLIGLLNGNRFGLPKHPRTVKLQGSWVEGGTAPMKQKTDPT